MLQCVAVCCSDDEVAHDEFTRLFQQQLHFSVAVCCSVLQCVAVCCSVLQTPHNNYQKTIPLAYEKVYDALIDVSDSGVTDRCEVYDVKRTLDIYQ